MCGEAPPSSSTSARPPGVPLRRHPTRRGGFILPDNSRWVLSSPDGLRGFGFLLRGRAPRRLLSILPFLFLRLLLPRRLLLLCFQLLLLFLRWLRLCLLLRLFRFLLLFLLPGAASFGRLGCPSGG